VHDGDDLGVGERRARPDDVRVELLELPVAAGLRALAAEDVAELVALEREGQVAVRGHVAGQRHGEVEAQRERLRVAGVATPSAAAGGGLGRPDAGAQPEHLLLRLAALADEHLLELDAGRVEGLEAVTLEGAPDRVHHSLTRDHLGRAVVVEPARQLGLDAIVGHLAVLSGWPRDRARARRA